jgi:hypothetical protein
MGNPIVEDVDDSTVIFFTPGIWIAFSTEECSALMLAAKESGWRPEFESAEYVDQNRWKTTLTKDAAAEMVVALELIRNGHSDRELAHRWFGHHGWKARLKSIVSILQSGPLTISAPLDWDP